MVDEVAEIFGELERGAQRGAAQAKPNLRADRPQAKPAISAAPAVAEQRDCLLAIAGSADARPGAVRQAVEAVAVARDGGVLLIGWVDDRDCPLDSVSVTSGSWRIVFDAATLIRVRRPDVEDALGITAPHLFGYFGLVTAPGLRDAPASVQVELRMKNGGVSSATQTCRTVSPEGLRDLTLGYLTSASFLGNPQAEAMAALDRGLGAQVVALNTAITGRITAARHVERFGTPRRQPLGSIVVCLYGKPEFLFVQNALFASRPGIEDYELIYVCNSPEITDALLDEARSARMIYGLQQTVVLLPGNAGFGAANNVGAGAALGRRIMAVNPDVFPRQLDWAARHTALVESRPAEQTRLFGAPLYYDDGSLMHGGMYFEMDAAVVVRPDHIERRRMARVEHYGKGAPPGATTYTADRPVPAVTGAFMSADRDWFYNLGGFTEDYVFGHYEDADLCLKSFSRGTPVWLHDLRLWHLEGKGSIRRPHHEGGSLVNRWLFTKTWFSTVADRMTGPNPSHPLMARPAVSAQELASAVPDETPPPRAMSPAPSMKTAGGRKRP